MLESKPIYQAVKRNKERKPQTYFTIVLFQIYTNGTPQAFLLVNIMKQGNLLAIPVDKAS